MGMPQKVDVALNIFARPYQTALSVLSLLKYSDAHVDKFYLQFEPAGSRYDAVPPYAVAEYLGERAVTHQPGEWLVNHPVDAARLADPAYRLAVRYQYAFERSDKKYLFTLHNDVLIKRDIIGDMLSAIDGAFAIGQIGQCWNCPARNAELMRECGCSEPCGPERYQDFRPDLPTLKALYAKAKERGIAVRGYLDNWDEKLTGGAWPLPECRVNEWACLVDLEQTRPLTVPLGPALPLGSFARCGSSSDKKARLDTAVAWFRDINRQGLRARHFPLDKYLKHSVGAHRNTRDLHREAELAAEAILLKAFPDFVDWCRRQKNGLFS